MSHVFMNKMEQNAKKEELFEILKKEMGSAGRSADMDRLEQVYEFACRAYEGMNRYSGDEYITHPLNVAIILAGMEADSDVVCAGLLCDVLKKTEVSAGTLEAAVPAPVAEVVLAADGIDMSRIDGTEKEEAFMVKLAERLHNMRTVEFMDEKAKAVKARETMELFMPAARRSGNIKLAEELNDLALKYV